MKTKEEILKPFVEIPFRHARIVDEDNALIAMELYAKQFMPQPLALSDSYNPESPRMHYLDMACSIQTLVFEYNIWTDNLFAYEREMKGVEYEAISEIARERKLFFWSKIRRLNVLIRGYMLTKGMATLTTEIGEFRITDDVDRLYFKQCKKEGVWQVTY